MSAVSNTSTPKATTLSPTESVGTGRLENGQIVVDLTNKPESPRTKKIQNTLENSLNQEKQHVDTTEKKEPRCQDITHLTSTSQTESDQPPIIKSYIANPLFEISTLGMIKNFDPPSLTGLLQPPKSEKEIGLIKLLNDSDP
jgi:hypothetical protein